jgi:hypothetical protein
MKQGSEKSSAFRDLLIDAAILIAIITVILNVSALAWWSGFLRYFNVPISDVNFTPSIMDFAIRGLAAIILIVVVSAVYILVIFLLKLLFDWLQGLAAKSKKKWVRSFSKENSGQVIDKYTFYVVSGVIALGAIFYVCYVHYDSVGYSAAQNKTGFSIMEEADEYVDIVIYQSDSVGIVKRYNKETGTFDEGFNIEDLVGKTLRFSGNAIK